MVCTKCVNYERKEKRKNKKKQPASWQNGEIDYMQCMRRKCEQCKNYINCFKYKKEVKNKDDRRKSTKKIQ